MYWRKKHNICIQNIEEWKFKVAENGNIQIEYLKIVHT